MNLRKILTGSKNNDGYGDTLREAFEKINKNFEEIMKEIDILKLQKERKEKIKQIQEDYENER